MRWACILYMALIVAPVGPSGVARAADEPAPETAAEYVDQQIAHQDDEIGHNDVHGQRGLIDLHWQEAAYTIVVFVIFFGVLSFVVWPRILKALQAREEKQRNDLVAAEKAAREAEATLAEYKQQLAEARTEAHKIIEQSKQDAHQIAQQLKDQAQSDINQMRDRASSEIEAAKKQAITEIYDQTAELATQVAGRILKREINASEQQALVTESLRELGEMN